MKKINPNLVLILFLTILSLALYLIQLVQFHSPRDTAFYFLQDMAFLPLQVSIVTIVLGKILSDREKRERMKNINMVINAFFNETGTDLIVKLILFEKGADPVKSKLNINEKWTVKDFQRTADLIKNHDFTIQSNVALFPELKSYLINKRAFLLMMIENPNLLEHASFTDMLWTIFHLSDELAARNAFEELPESDLNHLALDIRRAYAAILYEWLNHLAHLKTEYPYLYSLEIRKNPFNDHRNVIVR